jgi:hypothetical protein
MYKLLAFVATVVLFAGFVLLTVPVEAYRWLDRRLTWQAPSL